MKVQAYECNVKGRHWEKIVNHTSVGKAKSEYWRGVTDAWPDVPFTHVTGRCLGPPISEPAFLRNAIYRGMPNLRCGNRVISNGRKGTVVGHNASANFDIIFDDGRAGSVHPSEMAPL